jgi:hypothetical protein
MQEEIQGEPGRHGTIKKCTWRKRRGGSIFSLSFFIKSFLIIADIFNNRHGQA